MTEPDAIFSVPIEQAGGRVVDGEFRIWEQSPDSPDHVLVDLTFDGRRISVSSSLHFFEALLQIRRELEPKGIRLRCYGCSRSVYPSPMSLNMGYGEKAYKIELGRPARSKDLVSIFETGPDVVAATIEEQRNYYEQWVASLS